MVTKNTKTLQTNKLLSRKLILTSLVCVIAIILVALDKISGSEFLALITANVGVYNAANALSRNKTE